VVGFIEAVKLGIQRSFDFKGRSSRSEFWFFNLFMYIIVPFSMIFLVLVFPSIALIETLVSLLFFPYLAMHISWIAVNVRRLHDIGESGFLMLAIFVPILGQIYYIYYGCKQGDLFENKYGPPYDGTSLMEALSSSTICQKCNSENKSDASFCGSCGQRLGAS
tara:strand:+ start:280 stop:768 length:489 start_codon:yes stop_codon:yes gene_type:complete